MGNLISSPPKKNKKGQRFYRPPEVRAKDRFDLADTGAFVSQSDASIDKFDYLIVFPITEGASVPPKEVGSEPRITWAECERLWTKGVPGTDETKKEAVDHLAQFWKKRTGLKPKSKDEILVVAWKTIAREAIVDILMNKSGLQLKMTASNKNIYCRVRAPIKLLELQADLEDYRLQFRGEIDPGSEKFWNIELMRKETLEPYPAELDYEKIQYSRDEANAILEKLYKAGKISPNDLTVFGNAETEFMWNNRVHALERIADKVPIYNKYPVFAAFSTKPHLRYLYQTYPSVRGQTVFRCKDRLYLTKAVLDGFFDFDAFKDRKIISEILALHDANRGDRLTIDLLQRRWVTFWMVDSKEVGAATVTRPAYDEEVEAWFYERPFAQPLSDIREYFGEKVSLYFAWLGHYTIHLIIPALLGAGMVALFEVRGFWYTKGNFDWFTIGFGTLIMLWAALYLQNWERECSAIALKWGTRGFEDEEKDRPQFQGELERSTVDNRMELAYPEWVRVTMTILNFFLLAILVALDLGVIGGVFYADYLVTTEYTQYEFTYYSWAVDLLLAILIPIGSYLFLPVARMLNDNENHRTETEYEDALIKKALFFELFNNYGALSFIAFGKQYLFGTCSEYCVLEVAYLLIAIFIVRAAITVWRIIFPIAYNFLYPADTPVAAKGNGKGDEESAGLNEEADDNNLFMEEVSRAPYGGTFNNYKDAVVQFGYVCLFSVVLPFLAIIALVENLLKIRTEAWILCAFQQRPHVIIAEDVGTWADLMQIVSVLGVICSAGIICFTEAALDEFTTFERVIIFLSAEQVLLLLKFSVYYFWGPEPDWVEEFSQRNEYIEQKYVQGYEDDDDKLDLSVIKGTLDDTIDVDSMNLYDFRKVKKPTSDEYHEMEALESKRRDLMRELKTVKDELQRIYKTETFNDNTGIGETKHGLPLGRLTVKLVSLNFPEKEVEAVRGELVEGAKEYPLRVQLKVTIKATRQAVSAGPPVTDKSYSRPIDLKSGVIPVNQNMGPYAPIRTQDADVLFEVIDLRADKDKCVSAFVSVRLRELQDQQPHDMVLHFKMRHEETGTRASEASLYVTLLFQYSKVVPVRNRIYSVQEKLREVERELSRLKAGRSKAKDDEGGNEKD